MPSGSRFTRLRTQFNTRSERWRDQLATLDAAPQLALLGIFTGLITGIMMLGFRALIEQPQIWLFHEKDNFEALQPHWRILLPLSGALVLALIYHFLKPADRETGVIHVISRLHAQQGQLPLRNAILQFIAGTTSLLSGHSLGREGPAVHLGAATGSLSGQWLRLPHNNLRILVACGSAAAIAASFNTPLAGVIFAMEVIMQEYTIRRFVPVMLASATATLVTLPVYGTEPAFQVPSVTMHLNELPGLLLLALTIGGFAWLFSRLTEWTQQYTNEWSIWSRFAMVGLITGCIGYFLPEVLGVGYDTVEDSMLGNIALPLLMLILAGKLFASAIAAGTGFPAGTIGPSLVLGSVIGALTGALVSYTTDLDQHSIALYAMVGTGAMMGALLQAPMAALVALLEMTGNPSIILPGMLVIVIASLISGQGFHRPSIFMVLLQRKENELQTDPLSQTLQATGVRAVMNSSFTRHKHKLSLEDARQILQYDKQWLILDRDGQPASMMPMADLARHLEQLESEQNQALDEEQIPGPPEQTSQLSMDIDLTEIAAQRLDLAQTDDRVTLRTALDIMNEKQTDALYITRTDTPTFRIAGIIQREDIVRYYSPRNMSNPSMIKNL